MMNDYVYDFTPELSLPVVAVVLAVIVCAICRGIFYRPAGRSEGLVGFIETLTASIAVTAVIAYEHYDGLVQLLINALQHNTDSSAAWADIIACLMLVVLALVVGAAYLSIRKTAYRTCNHRVYARNVHRM